MRWPETSLGPPIDGRLTTCQPPVRPNYKNGLQGRNDCVNAIVQAMNDICRHAAHPD